MLPPASPRPLATPESRSPCPDGRAIELTSPLLGGPYAMPLLPPGHSDEYSFVLHKDCTLYERRARRALVTALLFLPPRAPRYAPRCSGPRGATFCNYVDRQCASKLDA